MNLTYYMKFSYAYVLVNNKTRPRMAYYKQPKGSSWINTFAKAER